MFVRGYEVALFDDGWWVAERRRRAEGQGRVIKVGGPYRSKKMAEIGLADWLQWLEEKRNA